MSHSLETELQDIVELIPATESLSEQQVLTVGKALIEASVSAELKKQLLTRWQERGEHSDEVTYLAQFFREVSTNPGLGQFSECAIDLCGTGGDKSGTFNISTATSFIVASAGVPVLKHGNRSITSKSGSADLLEALGIPLQSEPALLKKAVAKTNFVFLFAPAFHPAFKEIVPVRKALAAEGKKTVFNILGPLINPAKPNYQLMGVFSKDWVAPLAQTLTRIPLHRGLVVNSQIEEQSIDELTTVGSYTAAAAGELDESELSELKDLFSKIQGGSLSELKGGDNQQNIQILKQLLNFEAPQALLNTICLNAGAALRVCAKAATFAEGYDMAQTLLESGKTRDWLNATIDFYKNEA